SVALAAAAQRLGVRFMTTSRVDRILTDGARARGVATAEGEVEGDAVVVAAGAGTAALLTPRGLRSSMYPLKGYSVTLPAPDGNAHEVSITDEERKVVIGRLGGRLRAAGQAEVGGYDLTLERRRAEAVLSALESLFPQVGPEREAAEF